MLLVGLLKENKQSATHVVSFMEAFLDPDAISGVSIQKIALLRQSYLCFCYTESMSNDQIMQQLLQNSQHLNSLESTVSSFKQMMMVLIILTGITLLVNKC